MKYFFRVCVVLLVAVGIIFGYSYFYREKKNDEAVVLTTHAISTTKAGETTTENDKIEYYNDNGFELFVQKGKGYVLYNDVQKEIGGLDWALAQSSLDIYCGDWDKDKENELLLLYSSGESQISSTLLSRYNEDFSKYHQIAMMIKPVTDAEGKQDFNIVYADQNTWKKPFEQAINAQMNQVKSCDKFIQFVMDDNDVDLKYDKKTGISSNKYVYYATALKKTNGNGYQKFTKWSKGTGNYFVGDDGTLQLNIMLLAYYDEQPSKAQYVGNIHTGISINKKGAFTVTPKTIEFVANKKCACVDPRESASERFTYIINNSSNETVNTNDNYIDWLEYSTDLSPYVNEQTLSFTGLDSQIKCVEKVKVTQSSIVLTAKEGYVFSDKILAKGDYSVNINANTDDEYDIAYKAEILERDARSVLKITYDKKYTKDELKNIDVKFGA